MEHEWAEQERRLLYSCYTVASEAPVIAKDQGRLLSCLGKKWWR